jgi:hypothetical protein
MIQVSRALGDFFMGIHYEYPVCCVLQFSWDVLRGREGMATIRTGTHQYVPCSRCQRTGYVPQRLVDRWNAEMDALRCRRCWDVGWLLVGSNGVTACECAKGQAEDLRMTEKRR